MHADTLIATLVDVLDALAADGVHATLVGGLAVAVHGAPRATRDIDLLVDPQDLPRALEAVARVGFRHRAAPMHPSGVTIQRVTRIDDGQAHMLDFLLASGPLAELGTIDVAAFGRTLRVVDRAGLLRMKAMSGRLQDLADIARLTEGEPP